MTGATPRLGLRALGVPSVDTGRGAGYVKLGRPASLGSESRSRHTEWGVGPPRAGLRAQGRRPALPSTLPATRPDLWQPRVAEARPGCLQASGPRSESCTCMRAYPAGLRGAAARGQRPGRGLRAEPAKERGLTLGVGGAVSPPPLRAGARAVPPRSGAQTKLPGPTGRGVPPPPAPAAAAL